MTAERPERPTKVSGGTAEGSSCARQTLPACNETTEHSVTVTMEEVLSRSNMLQAYHRVVGNKGAAGVDGMTVDELWAYCQEHWERHREELLRGTYRPSPVRKVEIPKPGGKGMRMLGIPTVLHRLIQQALQQVLTRLYDPMFSDSSFGYRRGRSTHQALDRAKEHIASGHRWVVHMALEKFFDRVNHDILMSRLARQIKDKRILKLIRLYLQAGIMDGGVVNPRSGGTPQGGPLSPLLSNVLLDELDKELKRRDHKFVRYADDCNIYVRSRRAGERVLDGIQRLKGRLREELRKARGRNVRRVLAKLQPVLVGWVSYYRKSEAKKTFEDLDQWFRRKLRAVYWRQWKRPAKRARELIRLGTDRVRAWASLNNGHGPWWNAGASHTNQALPARYFTQLGLTSLV
ncbi:MAG: group II intron reverse transcriptase/maturase [Pirellulaceae bacterium]|nr:group II intron reverse transcriptase/maturase [Pirellulaceae bacterium]